MDLKKKLQFDKSLKNLCTFHIGGNAKYFIEVLSIEDLKQALVFAKEETLRFFILGKGSNVLFDDRGFDGLVIQNKIDFCNFKENQIHVGSGYSLIKLCRECSTRNLSGLEFGIGIPGSVGGAIYMNASAHNQSISNFLKEVLFIDEDGNEQRFLKKELIFDYRFSSFHEKKGVIISAIFELSLLNKVEEKTNSLLDLRKKNQPLDKKSAGCIFKNPPNDFAARLIDICNLKGKSIGGAMVSLKHANFIINEKDASSKDVLELIAFIKKEVKEKTGIFLEEEVCYVSFGR
jgi:UDP-N-acetylmuramate dehydrogenase